MFFFYLRPPKFVVQLRGCAVLSQTSPVQQPPVLLEQKGRARSRGSACEELEFVVWSFEKGVLAKSMLISSLVCFFRNKFLLSLQICQFAVRQQGLSLEWDGVDAGIHH